MLKDIYGKYKIGWSLALADVVHNGALVNRHAVERKFYFHAFCSLPMDIVCIVQLVNLITYVKIKRIIDINKLISVKKC